MKSYSKEKTYFKNSIDKIVTWLWDKYDVHVDFDHQTDNEFDDKSNVISINNKSNLRAQLYTLLHETGHFVLNLDKRTFNSHFPHGGSGFDKTSKKSKVDTIREEVYAWDKGLEIAKFLKIRVNKKAYNKNMTDALWSYISWANKHKRKKKKK
jgi:hypothetical protein